MDKLYMILLCLMIVPILICIKYSRKIKSDVASSIVKCLIFAIVTILSNGLSAFSGNETFSYIMEALYRFSFDLMLIYVLQYSQQYTRVFHEVSPFKKGCFIIAYLDGILLFLNIIFHNVFTIETVRFPNFDMYHVADKSIIFYFHYVFAYGLVVCIIASFIIKIIQIPDFYRKKYLPILVLICVITVSKFICGISEFPIDVSLPFFVCAAILICYLTLYRSSRELVDKTLSIVVNEMNNAVICFDINNECVYANERALKIFNSSLDSLSGISEDVQGWIKEHDTNNSASLEWSGQTIIDNKTYYFDIEYRKLFDKKNEYIGFFLNLIDNTEKHIAFEKEKYLATHDTLTGLYNKNYFAHKTSEILNENPDKEWLLICSNIKDFKLVNDLFGLEKGNEVLKMEADLLKAQCGEGSVYGRTGGDKFAICIPKEEFKEQDFMDAIQTMGHAFNNDLYHLHIYVGVYEITDRNEEVSIMCDKANLAIKTLGENYDKSIAYYNDTIFHDTVAEKQLVGDFDKALAEKQFCMYLQPQVNRDGAAKGAEALVRWAHPSRGILTPYAFIDILENAGLIYKLDLYIWEKAAQKLAEWKEKGYGSYHISVNISTKDFYIIDIYETFTGLINKYGIAASNLHLEITETTLMTDFEKNMNIIHKLQNVGFRVEIDDFGSGYSSLNMLKDISADVLKIDMGFLRKSENEVKGQDILESIITLAGKIGMDVITEGVETKKQLDMLTMMGCHEFQGYYFSKPVPVSEFEEKYLV